MLRNYVTSLSYMAWRGLAAVGRVVWTLVRPSLRFISAVLIVTAIVALTIDVTHWQTGNDGATFQSLEGHIRAAAPATLDGIGKAISDTLHPIVWDPVLLALLSLPAWLLLFVLGLLIGYAARERRQVNIFVN